jgi:hypothetical protein
MGWFLEELEPISLISHKQKNYVSLEYSLPQNEFTSPNKQHVENIERSSSPKLMVKKLNHNASERDRRKKVNSLISSLRSLLPGEDQTVLIHPSLSLLSVFSLIKLNWQQINHLIKFFYLQITPSVTTYMHNNSGMTGVQTPAHCIYNTCPD